MEIDPDKQYKQWAESYYDPPGILPGQLEEMEQRIEWDPGYHMHGRRILPSVETWDLAGNVLAYKVGLVVFIMEKDE